VPVSVLKAVPPAAGSIFHRASHYKDMTSGRVLVVERIEYGSIVATPKD
jgi:hypothetical protein